MKNQRGISLLLIFLMVFSLGPSPVRAQYDGEDQDIVEGKELERDREKKLKESKGSDHEDIKIDEDPEEEGEAGPIIYVDGRGTEGGNGQSWETAYSSLDQAVEDLNSQDGKSSREIWIAKGDYKLDKDLNLEKNVKIVGSLEGSETSLDELGSIETTIDGQNFSKFVTIDVEKIDLRNIAFKNMESISIEGKEIALDTIKVSDSQGLDFDSVKDVEGDSKVSIRNLEYTKNENGISINNYSRAEIRDVNIFKNENYEFILNLENTQGYLENVVFEDNRYNQIHLNSSSILKNIKILNSLREISDVGLSINLSDQDTELSIEDLSIDNKGERENEQSLITIHGIENAKELNLKNFNIEEDLDHSRGPVITMQKDHDGKTVDLDLVQLNTHGVRAKSLVKLNGGIRLNILSSTICKNQFGEILANDEDADNQVNIRYGIVYDNEFIDDDNWDMSEGNPINSLVNYSHSLAGNPGSIKDEWDGELGVDGGNNINKNPLFRDDRGQLKKDSPAINRLASEDARDIDWQEDILGKDRKIGDKIDLGAFEFDQAFYRVRYIDDKDKELLPDKIVEGVHGEKAQEIAADIDGYELVSPEDKNQSLVLEIIKEGRIDFKYRKIEDDKEDPEVPEGPGGGVIVPPVRPEKPEKPKDPEGPGSPELEKKIHFAYLEGYPDGSIRPEEDISREAVAAVFFRLLDEDYREKIRSEKNSFKDIAKTRWSNKHISTLAQGDILKGYEDGSFRPGKSITRGELASIIKRFSKEEGDGKVDFKDIGGHWAEEAIKEAASQGWIEGYEDGSFRPDKYISRAELTTLVNRVLEREPKLENILKDRKEFKDLKEDKWYYLPMIEAANGHDYDMVDGEEVWTELNDFDQEM